MTAAVRGGTDADDLGKGVGEMGSYPRCRGSVGEARGGRRGGDEEAAVRRAGEGVEVRRRSRRGGRVRRRRGEVEASGGVSRCEGGARRRGDDSGWSAGEAAGRRGRRDRGRSRSRSVEGGESERGEWGVGGCG